MTKIGFLRDEFERIGCVPPKNPFEPRLYVGWHYAEIIVSGIQEKLFDYDLLCDVLAQIPDGAGEEFFWRRVNKTDFERLARNHNRRFFLKLVN